MLRNVLLLIILKGNVLHVIYGPWCISATFHTYINICLQNASYVTEWSSSFPSPFATNLSYPFHISHNPTLPTHFSRHILSNVFDKFSALQLCFKIALWSLLSAMSLIKYVEINCFKTATQHQFLNDLTVDTWIISTSCARTKPKNAVGQKKRPIGFLQFSIILQMIKEFKSSLTCLFH